MRGTRPFLVFTFLVGSVGCASDNYRYPRARDDEQQPAISNGASPRIGDASVAGATDDTVRQTLSIPTGDRASSTLLVERLAPREARLNRAYDYRIRVTNLTQTPLTGVVVREKLPESFTISKSEPTGKDENGWRVALNGFGDRQNYAGDWTLRAAAAMAGIYGNSPAEAVYPLLATDSAGK